MIRFADSVISPEKVGFALGAISDSVIERFLLPEFLDPVNDKRRVLVRILSGDVIISKAGSGATSSINLIGNQSK